MSPLRPCLLLAACSYLTAALCYHGRWPVRAQRAKTWATILAGIGIAANLSALVAGSVDVGDWPLLTLRQTLVLFALAVPAAHLIVLRREPVGLGVFSCAVAVAAAVASLMVPDAAPVKQFDSRGLLLVHIVVAVVAYAAFGLAACCGAAYLCKEALLKRKRLTGFGTRLPSLETAEILGYRLAGFGFVLWTLMLALSIWYTARVTGDFWGWTPKQTWSLVTWAIYAAYLHARMVSNYRGRATVGFLVAGFVCACTTYVIANYLGDPHHL